MKFKLSNPVDFWAGVMYGSFGLLGVIVAREYPMGSAMRMGPGYFPTYIGVALIIIGAAISLLSLKSKGEQVGKFSWRALTLLAAAFVIFGWSVDHLGFIPALTILIILSSMAGRQFKLMEAIIEAIILLIACWAIFIYGLELPFPLFWWR